VITNASAAEALPGDRGTIQESKMNLSAQGSQRRHQPVTFCSMKYIVLDGPGLMGETFFVFPGALAHSRIANKFGANHVVSAGFVVVRAGGRFTCFGESLTLGVKSRPEADTELLNRENLMLDL